MKAALAAVGLLLVIVFSGCAEQPADAGGPFFQEIKQKVSDGRTVICLYKEGRVGGYSSGTTPAMSCDWGAVGK